MIIYIVYARNQGRDCSSDNSSEIDFIGFLFRHEAHDRHEKISKTLLVRVKVIRSFSSFCSRIVSAMWMRLTLRGKFRHAPMGWPSSRDVVVVVVVVRRWKILRNISCSNLVAKRMKEREREPHKVFRGLAKSRCTHTKKNTWRVFQAHAESFGNHFVCHVQRRWYSSLSRQASGLAWHFENLFISPDLSSMYAVVDKKVVFKLSRVIVFLFSIFFVFLFQVFS